MLRNILMPLDGSENAERALPWVRMYAGPERALVILVRVLPNPDFEQLDEARSYLLSIERELNFRGIPAKIRIEVGEAHAGGIVAAARATKADMIVMTTRGGSPVVRWLIGGVTEQVLRLSTTPVFVVRSQMALPRQARVRRILVPLDGSALADRAIPWAVELAQRHKASLVFFHVRPQEPPAVLTREAMGYEALHERTMARCEDLRRRGRRAIFLVETGDAALEILRHARSTDLIAMTTHGYGGVKRWIFGSVAEKVIREATVPVFVYKTPPPARTKADRADAGAAVR